MKGPEQEDPPESVIYITVSGNNILIHGVMLSTLQFLHENIIATAQRNEGLSRFLWVTFLSAEWEHHSQPSPRAGSVRLLPFGDLAECVWTRTNPEGAWHRFVPLCPDLKHHRSTELAPPRAQVCAKYIPCTVVKDLFIIPPSIPTPYVGSHPDG